MQQSCQHRWVAEVRRTDDGQWVLADAYTLQDDPGQDRELISAEGVFCIVCGAKAEEEAK